MAELKHTPGPWAARHVPLRGISDDTWCIDWSDDQEEVAEIVHGEANARLIAASTKLLEVATWLVRIAGSQYHGDDAAEEFDALVSEARAAIAKATGA